jgi:hypothetical protein
MIRRALTVLLAVLVAACAGATGFNEAPHAGQLIFLVLTCFFAAALQAVTASKIYQL